MMNHPDECNCEDCTLLYMVQPQEIDMEEDSKTIVPSSTTSSTTTTLCASPRLPLMNHPDECDCANCTLLYMLLPQEIIDMEEDSKTIVEIIVPSSPTSSTTTLCVSDSDSDDQVSYDEELQINVNIFTKVQDVIDIDEDIVPGVHSPYSLLPCPSMFPEPTHLSFPNYMYGVDTPFSPPSSP